MASIERETIDISLPAMKCLREYLALAGGDMADQGGLLDELLTYKRVSRI